MVGRIPMQGDIIKINLLYIPLRKTRTVGNVLLDQLVTIDYNVRSFSFVETIPSALLQHILSITVMVFQPNVE